VDFGRKNKNQNISKGKSEDLEHKFFTPDLIMSKAEADPYYSLREYVYCSL
jgi:hypothetical protein